LLSQKPSRKVPSLRFGKAKPESISISISNLSWMCLMPGASASPMPPVSRQAPVVGTDGLYAAIGPMATVMPVGRKTAVLVVERAQPDNPLQDADIAPVAHRERAVSEDVLRMGRPVDGLDLCKRCGTRERRSHGCRTVRLQDHCKGCCSGWVPRASPARRGAARDSSPLKDGWQSALAVRCRFRGLP